MNIAVIGTGYVGLVTGACLSAMDRRVVCADIDAGKIEKLNRGILPIYEPGLEKLVAENSERGMLSFTTEVKAAAASAQVVFLAVGTPSLPDGRADLSYVFSAVGMISAVHKGYQVIVTKSTVPVGTGERIEARLADKHPRDTFSVVSNPEFLREGAAVGDFMDPARIVIGCEDERALKVMRRLYEPQTSRGVTLLTTNRASAEIIKYASNAFLATKISFINEISLLCEKVGADVMDVARGMGLDSRIGASFLNPGPGYGGSCFPKDTRALLDVAASKSVPLRIVEGAVKANFEQAGRSFRMIKETLSRDLQGSTVAMLGLAFKGDTDDVRESPALKIASLLLEAGVVVKAYDPVASENARVELPGLLIEKDPYAAADGADLLVVATEWGEFGGLDLDKLATAVKGKVIVDLRNIIRTDRAAAAGFACFSPGRAPVKPRRN